MARANERLAITSYVSACFPEYDMVWQLAFPPKGNANLLWVQPFIRYRALHSKGGFVLANGRMSSAQFGEGYIRRALSEADLADCTAATNTFHILQ